MSSKLMPTIFQRLSLFVILSILALAGTASAALGAPQLQAFYTFDGGSGNVADSSGNKLGGTPYGGAQYVKLGRGYVLSPGTKGFVKCAARNKPAFGTGDFTVQVWLKLDGYRSGGIIGKQGQKQKSRGWAIAYDGISQGVTFYVANGQQRRGVSAPLKDLKWHRLTAVRQGHTLTIYIDGKRVSSQSNPFFDTNVNSTTYLFLGRTIGHPASFNGKLDNVRLYTGAMSSSAIAQTFAANKNNLVAYRRAAQAKRKAATSGPALILHYTFKSEPHNNTVKDLSTYSNNGKISNAKYIKEVNGRKGVLRFNGTSSMLKVAASPSLNFGGDMTLEMWVRMNGPITDNFAWIMGEIPPRNYFFGISGYLTFLFRYSHYNHVLQASEDTPVPISASDYFSHKWEHIAIVVEYPRCLFYKNGKLIRNAYMPLPGIMPGNPNPIYIGGSPRGYAPIDLDEIRLYQRALTPKEIAADAHNNIASKPTTENYKLKAVKHRYRNKLILRLASKGIDQSGHNAKLLLFKQGQSKPAVSQIVPFELALGKRPGIESRDRYQAEVEISLPSLAGQSYLAVARVMDSGGQSLAKIKQKVSLKKPAWVENKLGDYDGVLKPWTPVEIQKSANGGVKVGVWGRWYVFGDHPFPTQITSGGDNLLTDPITLSGKTDKGAIAWRHGSVKLKKASKTKAKLQQKYTTADGLSLQINTKIAYDGYTIFDCALTAKRDLTLNKLTLTIPLRSKYAKLCYGNRVQPKHKDKNGGRMPISPWYSGAVKGNLSFKFAPSIWLGNAKGGLTWQASSDQYWHYAKKYQAIEILPDGTTTRFVAHFVDVPTHLQAGQTLHYKFALLATPVKPMGKTYWDLRIMRAGPFGNVFHYPDKTIQGKPELKLLSDLGVRHIYYYIGDIWPWPMPVHQKFKSALRRLVRAAHKTGIKVIPYVIHERFPVMVPEFDTHGLLMAKRPMEAYVPRGVASYPHPRPGSIGGEYGAEAQGDVFFCPKSQALEDAYIYSLAQRLKKFNEDGVYLDGTAQIVPDRNLLHGCGYIAKDGTVHKTYPVFAVRKFMKRIYTVVKQDNPNNIVFVHGSWGNNAAGLAYADIHLTGEQWWYLPDNGTDYVPGEFPLAQSRTEFLGRPYGVPVAALSYRLGSAMRMAAETLLNDVPVELNQGGRSTKTLLGLSAGVKKNAPSGSTPQGTHRYATRLIRLWHVRAQFGAKQAQKIFYWQKKQSNYATVSPDKCYLLIFKHPTNGALVFVTNLSRQKHNVTVHFNLAALGFAKTNVKAVDIFTRKVAPISSNGQVSIPLGSQQWTYLWLKPE